MTRSHQRVCLLGVLIATYNLRGLYLPKKPKKVAWLRIFQPKWQNAQIAISPTAKNGSSPNFDSVIEQHSRLKWRIQDFLRGVRSFPFFPLPPLSAPFLPLPLPNTARGSGGALWAPPAGAGGRGRQTQFDAFLGEILAFQERIYATRWQMLLFHGGGQSRIKPRSFVNFVRWRHAQVCVNVQIA